MKTLLIAAVVFLAVGAAAISAQTYTTTFSKDGKTIVLTKTISGGTVTIEQKTYDSGGNLLDTKVTTKDAAPAPVKEAVYPTKALLPSTTPTVKNTPMVTPAVSPTPKAGGSQITNISVKVKSDLPIEVSDEGKLSVLTNNETVNLKTLPEEAAEKATTAGLREVTEIKVVLADGGVKYELTGVKLERLLALFRVKLPTVLVIDTETGNLEKVGQSPLVRLADKLSI